MDDECLSLTWNNHGATYRQTLNVLRQENTLTDVTLACDGQKFTAHKLVLVTCSDYFRSILGDVPCQHPIVYLRGVAAKEMQALIDFMYTGQTDIPQKEVPTLLSTAEALQIKGLGVFSSGDAHDAAKGSPSKRDKNSGMKKRRPEHAMVLNGSSDENTKRSADKSDQLLENLYSHHYAFKSPPKRRRIDDRTLLKTSDSLSNSDSDKYSSKEASSSSSKENLQINPNFNLSGALNEIIQQCQQTPSVPPSSSSNSVFSAVAQSEPQFEYAQSETQTSTSSASEALKQRILSQNRSPLSQQPIHNPRSEANTASPRALNYSLSGLGGGKDDYNTESLYHALDDTNGATTDSPDKLLKSEVKEEALDFSNNSFADNLHGDSITAALTANNIEEETKIYLDAFARSANLMRQAPPEETQEVASVDGRPFVCPICQKCFAKAAILKRHHLAHFRPYVCHLCTRSFTRREVLAEHVLEHNGADLRMPCPVCNMTIKRKRNLQAHIKVKHPEYYKQKIESRESLC